MHDTNLTSCQEFNGTVLDLSAKRIATLHNSSVFANLASVTLLNLDDNNLVDLPAGVFDSLTIVAVLYVELPWTLGMHTMAVRNVRCCVRMIRVVSSNQLTSIPAGVFNSLTALTNL